VAENGWKVAWMKGFALRKADLAMARIVWWCCDFLKMLHRDRLSRLLAYLEETRMPATAVSCPVIISPSYPAKLLETWRIIQALAAWWW
jgi:hypothetical protein